MSVSDAPIMESTAPRQLGRSNDPRITGIHEITVTHTEVGSKAISRIYRLADERAEKVCDDYTVVRERLRFGDDATSRFAGIGGPWLELTIQCATVERAKLSHHSVEFVRDAARKLKDVEYFDIHSEILVGTVSQVFPRVKRVLEANGDPVFSADESSGLILTGRARHGAPGLPLYEQYVLSVESAGKNSTRMTFMLLSHVRDMAAGADRIILVPSERRYVYRRAAWFVERVREAVR